MKTIATLAISISDTSISTAIIAVPKTKAKKHPKKGDTINSANVSGQTETTLAPAGSNASMDDKPKILSYRVSSFNVADQDLTLNYLESRCKILLRQILDKTRYEDLPNTGFNARDIDKVIVSLSAPWFEGKTVISHFEEAKEFKVSPLLLKKAFDAEIKSFSGKTAGDIVVLESSVLSATLNGYTVADPLGKSANSLSITGYISYMKTAVRDQMLETIKSFFHSADEIIIKSEPLILLSAALRESDLKGITSDFAIIRVNEVVTHLQIVRNKHIREIGTIPLGLNSILSNISESFSSTQDASLDILNMFLAKKLHETYAEKLQKILEDALGAWRQALKDFSAETITSGKFPTNVFLSSPTAASGLFKNYLVKDDYLDMTMSSNQLLVDILDRSTLNEFIDIDREKVKRDPGFLTKLIALM